MSEQIKEQDDPMARFLAEGGKIQQGAYKESGRVEGASNNIWGTRKPGRPAANAPTPIIESDDDK
jgi:hypothetical protein